MPRVTKKTKQLHEKSVAVAVTKNANATGSRKGKESVFKIPDMMQSNDDVLPTKAQRKKRTTSRVVVKLQKKAVSNAIAVTSQSSKCKKLSVRIKKLDEDVMQKMIDASAASRDADDVPGTSQVARARAKRFALKKTTNSAAVTSAVASCPSRNLRGRSRKPMVVEEPSTSRAAKDKFNRKHTPEQPLKMQTSYRNKSDRGGLKTSSALTSKKARIARTGADMGGLSNLTDEKLTLLNKFFGDLAAEQVASDEELDGFSDVMVELLTPKTVGEPSKSAVRKTSSLFKSKAAAKLGKKRKPSII